MAAAATAFSTLKRAVPVGGAEVEEEVAAIGAYVDGVVVGFDAAGGVGGQWPVVSGQRLVVVVVVVVPVGEEGFAVGGDKGAVLDEEASGGVDLGGELEIGFEHVAVVAVDVEVVGVGGGDDGHVWMEL